LANNDEKQVDMVLNSIKKEKKIPKDNEQDKKEKDKESRPQEPNNNKDNDTNGIVIEPDRKKNTKTYRGYYLENNNLKRLNSISEQTGKDKSQLVNMALNFFFDNLTIKRK